VEALKSRDLYRVGIALHSFADTYAHQNFTGRKEDWNRLSENSPIPPIGHAQAGTKPDGPVTRWSDPRLREPAVDNRVRWLSAARKVYKYLATYNRRGFDDVDWVIDRLAEIIGTGDSEKTDDQRIVDFVIECEMEEYRRNDWKALALELDETTGGAEISGFQDKLLWLQNEVVKYAAPRTRRSVRARPGFYRSQYFRWHEAARAQLKAAHRELAHLA
jgi:hypothetical protein